MRKKCSILNCEDYHYSKGYCQKHYDQLRYHGTTKERNQHTPNNFIIEGNFCKIECYNINQEVIGYDIIDIADMDKCKQYKWRFCNTYTTSSKLRNELGYGACLHHLIAGIKPSYSIVVDHRNKNKRDNRRDNLRICTNSQNHYNSVPHNRNTSGYKGVSWSSTLKKWSSHINANKVEYKLGAFSTKEEAAKAYDAKARELHGEFAYQNFPKPKLIRRIL